jgi:type III pantothenate kinase
MSDNEFTLSVDIGNSRIKFGVFEPAPVKYVLPNCTGSLAVSVHDEVDWKIVTAHFATWTSQIARAAVAGVNPAGMQRLLTGWSKTNWPPPTIVDLAADLPLRTNVEKPDHVGIDRLLDAVAANLLRSPQQPAIIIDTGTATTVNALSADGVFEGGAILPGLKLQARSLHQDTALLPQIDVHTLAENPVAALGRNTHDAIQSGLWFGQIGAIRELTARLTQSFGESPLLLVTGGMGRWLAPALGDQFRFEPDLALRALAFVVQGGDAKSTGPLAPEGRQ